MTARNPTAPRSIQLPDDSGLVHLNPSNTGIGTVMFGTSTDDSDTGNEVCQSVDLICVFVRTMAGAASDCSTDQGSAPTLFHAYCRR